MAETGELVSLMARVAPKELRALQQRFPGDVHLVPGGVLGGSRNDRVCQITLPALVAMSEAANRLLPKLRRRLKWSWRFDLLSKFAAAIGSSGACGAIIAGAEGGKALIPAALAVVGSLSSLIFSYLQRDEAAGSVSETYNRLISGLVDAGDLGRRLPALCEAAPSEELEQALKLANDTARMLNELILRYD